MVSSINYFSFPADDDMNSPIPISLSVTSPTPVSLTRSTSVDVQENDILCGRDKISFQHPGNKWFRSLVQSYRERYQTARMRDQKTRISNEIVAIIEKRGGRFLKFDTELGMYQALDSAGAHDKVSHALRSAKMPKKAKLQSVGSSNSIAEQDLLPVSTGDDETYRRLSMAQKLIYQNLLEENNLKAEAHRQPQEGIQQTV